MAGNIVWKKINLQIKLTLKGIGSKENAINRQCLRYDDDYSIAFSRYSTSELKKGPSKTASFKF